MYYFNKFTNIINLILNFLIFRSFFAKRCCDFLQYAILGLSVNSFEIVLVALLDLRYTYGLTGFFSHAFSLFYDFSRYTIRVKPLIYYSYYYSSGFSPPCHCDIPRHARIFNVTRLEHYYVVI